MKYVVFKFASLYIPVIIPECCTHSQIKIKGGKAVSAGFFKIGKYGFVEILEKSSESLKLSPNLKRDKKLLELLLSEEHNTSRFLDFNF